MPVDIKAGRIFLASPGGLVGERKVCRKVIRSYNECHFEHPATAFQLLGWEDRTPGVGRAQARINDDVRRSDYLVLLMTDRWGSDPGGSGRYTSGTEEEFHLALEMLGDAGAPMRDVLVLFGGVGTRQMSDPGDDLKRVLAFRKSLEEGQQIMYGRFDSKESLARHLDKKLDEWAAALLKNETKEARQIEIQPSTVLEGAADGRPSIEFATQLAANGRIVEAEVVFARVSADGDPQALSQYARYSRRWGLAERSIELDRNALASLTGVGGTSADVDLRARVLTNMGITQRSLGKLSDSLTSLLSAARLLEDSNDAESETATYVWDNLGLTQMRFGDFESALENFKHSLKERQSRSDHAGIAQSLANIGRVQLTSLNFDEAQRSFEDASSQLDGGQNSDARLRANILSGLAEASVRAGALDGADQLLDEAERLNQDIGDKFGLSVVKGLRSRVALEQDDPELALRFAQDCLELSRNSGNELGLGVAKLAIANVLVRSQQDLDEAWALVLEAKHHAERARGRLLVHDIDEFLRSHRTAGPA